MADDPNFEIVENDDGSAEVFEGGQTALRPRDTGHFDNLAEDLSDSELTAIGVELDDLIQKDKEARTERDDKTREGLQRTGLGDDAPGGATFAGASKVVHPLMTEASIDFAARAIKELFPPGGPVKPFIKGEATQERIDKARAKADFMNRQLCGDGPFSLPEFRWELEQLLSQLSLGGSQFFKMWHDPEANRARAQAIFIDDIYLPYAATSYYGADRRSHAMLLTDMDLRDRMASGMYLDIDLSAPAFVPDESETAKANNRIQGQNPDAENPDGLRSIIETDCYYDLGDGMAPYLITWDLESRKVLSIYRNWREGDDTKARIDQVDQATFVPWRGPYGIGFPQMLGSLTAAATGALRALLDSAHIQNAPTALKLKGNNLSGQSMTLAIGTVNEVEGGVGMEDPDIRKIAMPLPFPGPSATLFQLLGFLVDAGKGVVRTTLDETSDTNQNVPVGTTLARLQEGMVVFNSIHARLHEFMGRLIKRLYYLNSLFLPEQPNKDGISRADFNESIDVGPISDPNVFSDVQRDAQLQMISARAASLAPLGIYDLYSVEEAFLQQSKVPDYKRFLNPRPEPKELNAVNENAAAMTGRPIVAFPMQDHLAHIQAHLDFMMNPILGGNELVKPKVMPSIISHIVEHMAFWYVMECYDLTKTAASGLDPSEVLKDKDPEVKRRLDVTLAAASGAVLDHANKAFSALPPIIQQALQYIESRKQPMPMDPSIVAQQDVQRQAQADQMNMQVKQMELQLKQREAQDKTMAEMQKMQAQMQEANNQRQADLEMLKSELMARMAEVERKNAAEIEKARIAAEAKLTANAEDNQTARELAAAEIESNEKVALSNGTGVDPGSNPRP